MKTLYLRYFYWSLAMWPFFLAGTFLGGVFWGLSVFLLFVGLFWQKKVSLRALLWLSAFLSLLFLRYFYWEWQELHREASLRNWEVLASGQECQKRTYAWRCVLSSPWGKLRYESSESIMFKPGFSYELQAFLEPEEENWTKAKSIFWETSDLRILSVEPGQQAWSSSLRAWVQQRLKEYLSPSAWALALGLMYGEEAFFTESDKRAFQNASLSHLVAISGYNISLLIQIFYALLSFLTRRWRLFFAGLAVLFFCAFVGFQSSVLRACWMGLLVLWARISGQSAGAMPLLLVTAFAMTFDHPYRLLYDIGFQLSFMACLGLLWKLPWEKNGKVSAWKEFFMTPFYATIYTSPVILYHFGMLYPFGIFANLLAAPVVSLAMFGSFLTLFFTPLAKLTQLLLDWILWIAFTFSALPYAFVRIPFSKFVALCLLILLALGTIWKYRLFLKMFFRPFVKKYLPKKQVLSYDTACISES